MFYLLKYFCVSVFKLNLTHSMSWIFRCVIQICKDSHTNTKQLQNLWQHNYAIDAIPCNNVDYMERIAGGNI